MGKKGKKGKKASGAAQMHVVVPHRQKKKSSKKDAEDELFRGFMNQAAIKATRVQEEIEAENNRLSRRARREEASKFPNLYEVVEIRRLIVANLERLVKVHQRVQAAAAVAAGQDVRRAEAARAVAATEALLREATAHVVNLEEEIVRQQRDEARVLARQRRDLRASKRGDGGSGGAAPKAALSMPTRELLVEVSQKMTRKADEIPLTAGSFHNTNIATVMEQLTRDFACNPELCIEMLSCIVEDGVDRPIIAMNQAMIFYEGHLLGEISKTLKMGNNVKVRYVAQKAGDYTIVDAVIAKVPGAKMLGRADNAAVLPLPRTKKTKQLLDTAARDDPGAIAQVRRELLVKRGDPRGRSREKGQKGQVSSVAGTCLGVPIDIKFTDKSGEECEETVPFSALMALPVVTTEDGGLFLTKKKMDCYALIEVCVSGRYYFAAEGGRAKDGRAACKLGIQTYNRLKEQGKGDKEAGLQADVVAVAALRKSYKKRGSAWGARDRFLFEGFCHMDGGTGLEPWTCATCTDGGGAAALPAGGGKTARDLLNYNQCKKCGQYNPIFPGLFGNIVEHQQDRVTRPLQTIYAYTQGKKVLQSAAVADAQHDHIRSCHPGEGTFKGYPSEKPGILLAILGLIKLDIQEHYAGDDALREAAMNQADNIERVLLTGLQHLLPAGDDRKRDPGDNSWTELTGDIFGTLLTRDDAKPVKFYVISLKAYLSVGFGYAQRNRGGDLVDKARAFLFVSATAARAAAAAAARAAAAAETAAKKKGGKQLAALAKKATAAAAVADAVSTEAANHTAALGDNELKAFKLRAAKPGRKGEPAKIIVSEALQNYLNSKFLTDNEPEFAVKFLRDILGTPKELDGLAACLVVGAHGEDVHGVDMELLINECFQPRKDAADDFCAVAVHKENERNSQIYFLWGGASLSANMRSRLKGVREPPDTAPKLALAGAAAAAKRRDCCVKKITELVDRAGGGDKILNDALALAKKAELILSFNISLKRKGSASNSPLGMTFMVPHHVHRLLTLVFPMLATVPPPTPTKGGAASAAAAPASKHKKNLVGGGGPRKDQLVLNIEENFDMEIMRQKKSSDLYYVLNERCPRFVDFLENYVGEEYEIPSEPGTLVYYDNEFLTQDEAQALLGDIYAEDGSSSNGGGDAVGAAEAAGGRTEEYVRAQAKSPESVISRKSAMSESNDDKAEGEAAEERATPAQQRRAARAAASAEFDLRVTKAVSGHSNKARRWASRYADLYGSGRRTRRKKRRKRRKTRRKKRNKRKTSRKRRRKRRRKTR